MLDIRSLQQTANTVVKEMPWLNGISTKNEYNQLIEVMGELVEDYDTNHVLIDLMFPVIEKYEENSEQFKAFNKSIETLDSGIATLRVLIDQYGLSLSDFKNEIGGKSSVSMILNGKRSLTIPHIKALSTRFNIPRNMFI
jgi:HTH-type transcriptional regulator / antitoxin HigA